jgi:predicted dehydrogenase
MAQNMHRRDMIRNTTLAGVGVWLAGTGARAESNSPNEKLNIAVIGIGGRGRANLNGVARENVVALCDVDDKRAGDAYEKFPKAKKFYDFRKMLEEMDSQIDAVVVSTPDHMHAHPSVMAMRMGKHLYCEKPMAHSVYEVRLMTDLAREKKIATQLGVQRHTIKNMHRVVEKIQQGAIGDVAEVHSWIGGSRGMPSIPKDTPPVPDTLKWDLWIGAGPMRPYAPSICP